MTSPSMRTALTKGLQNQLFASLNNERKVEVCSVLLEIGAQQGGNIVRVLLQNINLRIYWVHSDRSVRPFSCASWKTFR
jgi:hypothetical protein